MITPPTLHSSSVPQSSSFIFTLVFKIYTQSFLRLPILRPRTHWQDAHEAFTLHSSISNFHLLSLHSRCIVLPSFSILHPSPSSSFCPLFSFFILIMLRFDDGMCSYTKVSWFRGLVMYFRLYIAAEIYFFVKFGGTKLCCLFVGSVFSHSLEELVALQLLCKCVHFLTTFSFGFRILCCVWESHRTTSVFPISQRVGIRCGKYSE